MQEFLFQEMTPATTAKGSALNILEDASPDAFTTFVKPLSVRVSKKKTL